MPFNPQPLTCVSALMRIYLTGFMGAGKSYAGRQLAERLQYPFTDLDQLIEHHAERSISEIFEDYGEATFRDLETQTLRSLLSPHLVIATGGGAPCYHDNMAWMNEHGLTIFLDPDPAILLTRLRPETADRPLLQQADHLTDLIARKRTQRLPTYAKAQVRITYDDESVDVVNELLKAIENQSLR